MRLSHRSPAAASRNRQPPGLRVDAPQQLQPRQTHPSSVRACSDRRVVAQCVHQLNAAPPGAIRNPISTGCLPLPAVYDFHRQYVADVVIVGIDIERPCAGITIAIGVFSGIGHRLIDRQRDITSAHRRHCEMRLQPRIEVEPRLPSGVTIRNQLTAAKPVRPRLQKSASVEVHYLSAYPLPARFTPAAGHRCAASVTGRKMQAPQCRPLDATL
jgi:hypothetical protein